MPTLEGVFWLRRVVATWTTVSVRPLCLKAIDHELKFQLYSTYRPLS
jgi:hypothetical protein